MATHAEEVLKTHIRVLGNLSVVLVLSLGTYLSEMPSELMPCSSFTVEIHIRWSLRKNRKRREGLTKDFRFEKKTDS